MLGKRQMKDRMITVDSSFEQTLLPQSSISTMDAPITLITPDPYYNSSSFNKIPQPIKQEINSQ
jgi:hypothetical protein